MLKFSFAEKLLQLLDGEKIPSSRLRDPEARELLSENILIEIRQGRTKSSYQLLNAQALHAYVFNHYDINNLHDYVHALRQEEITRAELTVASSDSKIRGVRSFKGFLVNSYEPIPATLNGTPIIIQPIPGMFQFIYDYEAFAVAEDIFIVGVENAENFRYIEKQQYLFSNIKALFVCRYPQNQNKDLIHWLLSVKNQYLHFGDFDFAGINIFFHEYAQHLGDRAEFFIPPHIDRLLKEHGNSNRYNQQANIVDTSNIHNEKLIELIKTIHRYKKGLDQESFIKEIEIEE